MLSVVIPLFNEEDNIAPLQEELAAALAGREYELVLVDDCSTDRTLERIVPLLPKVLPEAVAT